PHRPEEDLGREARQPPREAAAHQRTFRTLADLGTFVQRSRISLDIRGLECRAAHSRTRVPGSPGTGGESMATRRILLLIPVLVLGLAAGTTADTTLSPSGPMLGFSNDHATAEHALETRFDSHLDAADLRAWMKRLTARPHHVGSPYGKENAEFMAGLF